MQPLLCSICHGLVAPWKQALYLDFKVAGVDEKYIYPLNGKNFQKLHQMKRFEDGKNFVSIKLKEGRRKFSN